MFDYINDTYGLDVKRGTRVKYTGGDTPLSGTVTGVHSASLKIRMDGEKSSSCYHPTWEIEYLPTHASEDVQS